MQLFSKSVRLYSTWGDTSTSDRGYTKKINLTSWNEKESKYDVRSWSPDHGKCGRGIILTEKEAGYTTMAKTVTRPKIVVQPVYFGEKIVQELFVSLLVNEVWRGKSSVRTDKSRNNISRPGFTAFPSRRACDRKLEDIVVKDLR